MDRREFLTLSAAFAAARALPSLLGQPPAPGLAPDGIYKVTELTETETKVLHVELNYPYSIPGILPNVKLGDMLRKITLMPQEDGKHNFEESVEESVLATVATTHYMSGDKK